jgi:GR25 family glycosyltransferase involved in LPS biosynthesis
VVGAEKILYPYAMNLLTKSYATYINMHHRTDRFLHMQNELARASISAYRSLGMPPEMALRHFGVSPARVKKMQDRTPGAIGCHFSQVRAMKMALDERKHAFVMEDDLVFCDDFQERMQIISDFCTTHPWDVIWLGGTFHVNPPWWHKKFGRDAEQTDHPRMMRTYGAFSTHAYIVNYDSIEKVLTMLDSELDNSIGIDYAFIQMQHRLHTYAFVPGCVIQMDNKSDIGKGMTIFSGFKKLGPYWFQKRMTDFNPETFNWHEATKR